jgi:hypothetical protein
VVDEFPNWNLWRQRVQSAEVIAMPVRDDQVIDLLKPRVLDSRHDASSVSDSAASAVSRIYQQRFL